MEARSVSLSHDPSISEWPMATLKIITKEGKLFCIGETWVKYRKKQKLGVIWPLKAEYILNKLSWLPQLSVPILSPPRPGRPDCLLHQRCDFWIITINSPFAYTWECFHYLKQKKLGKFMHHSCARQQWGKGNGQINKLTNIWNQFPRHNKYRHYVVPILEVCKNSSWNKRDGQMNHSFRTV